jgi:AhpD family alkylhydroperoxidase
MPYIPVVNELPGIIGLLETYTETGCILKQFANTLLNKETEAFNKSERETVASYISYLNNCQFCYKSHSAIADCLWKQRGKTKEIIENSNIDNQSSDNQPSDKISYILFVAKKLHNSVQGVEQRDISLLYTNYHFTSQDINDLILIISSFCMFNRYVDGLGTFHTLNDDAYYSMGNKIAEHGYL